MLQIKTYLLNVNQAIEPEFKMHQNIFVNMSPSGSLASYPPITLHLSLMLYYFSKSA